MDFERVSTGTTWEEKFGYCRAVKAHDTIHVSGTTATNQDGEIIGVGDPFVQTKKCIQNIKTALNEFDAGLDIVIRTRLFVTNIDHFNEIARAHSQFFDDFRPATTVAEISGLADEDMLLEMEAEAKVNP